MTDKQLKKLIEESPNNMVIRNALIKCVDVLDTHEKVMLSVSGGGDSDVMLDMVIRCGGKDKTDFVFFDTGIEYKATYEHLEFLEKKYDIEIIRVKPIKPIPLAVKEYGVPFLNKNVSDNMYFLRLHNFDWKDGEYDELCDRFGTVRTGIKWWTNKNIAMGRQFAIANNKFLKEFIMENPPSFKISKKCCEYAKKKASKKFEKEHEYDLKCMGFRKCEGGVRKAVHKTCFNEGATLDNFRPIWWFSDADKEQYCQWYGVTHSRCYTEYGMKRTGCVGCPYAIDFEDNLRVMQEHEPQLYKLANAVFGEAYEYTRQYRKFREEKERRDK